MSGWIPPFIASDHVHTIGAATTGANFLTATGAATNVEASDAVGGAGTCQVSAVACNGDNHLGIQNQHVNVVNAPGVGKTAAVTAIPSQTGAPV